MYACLLVRRARALGPQYRARSDGAAGDARYGFDHASDIGWGIHGFEQAEALLTEGKADIVGFARQAKESA